MESIAENLAMLHRGIARLGRITTEPDEFVAVNKLEMELNKVRQVFEYTKDLDEKNPMRKNEIYQQFEQNVILGNYTIDQVRSVTYDQAKNILGRDDFSTTFLDNMKTRVIAVLLDDEDQSNFQSVKNKVKTWLDNNFPGWAAERHRDGDKPSVTFWLKGKPE